MHNKKVPYKYTCLATVLSSLLTLNVNAEENQEQQEQSGLEVIEVRAQKRVEPLQETPIAITAFTADALDRKGINDISGIAKFTPNLVFDTHTPIGGASSAAAVFIRGIGNTDFSLTTDPGVGTYVDGVYMSRSIGGVLDVLDVTSIEVLRGPQGTLFGRNTIGGAVNITSRKPYDELAGHAQLTIGNFNRVDFRGAIDIPLTDELLSTFAISRKERDGYVKKVLQGDELGGQDRLALRAAFHYEPSDDWTFQLALDYTDYDEESAPGVAAGFTAGAGTIGYARAKYATMSVDDSIAAALTDLNQYVVKAGDDRSFGIYNNGSTVEGLGASFITTYSADNFEIKYVGAYRETDASFEADADASPEKITHISNPKYEHEQTSHELQITGDLLDGDFKYAAGIYRFDEEGIDSVFVPLTLPSPDLAIGFEAELNNFAEVDNSSQAYYFQGTWAATEQFKLTLGARYTEDEKGFAYTQYIGADREQNGFPFFPGAVVNDGSFVPGLLPLVGNGTGSDKNDFNETTYKFGADYALSDSSLLYYSFSQGFKGGGYVLRYVESVAQPRTFEPELLDTHEIGMKWENSDNTVRVNSAVFYTDYSDIQVTFFDNQGGPITANAGEAEIKGFELEVNALLTDELLFELGYGYTDAKYTEINPVAGLSLTIDESAKLVNTPENSFNASLEYRTELASDEFSARIDYSYTDDIFNDSQNSPFLYQDAYSLVNASINYRFAESWNITVFVENLTDKRVIESGNSNFGLGFHEARYNRPREYGITARYDF